MIDSGVAQGWEEVPVMRRCKRWQRNRKSPKKHGIYEEVESIGEPDEENQGLDAVGHIYCGQQKM